MKKIIIDTNIWLRFFLKDDKMQFEKVRELISDVEAGKFRTYTSSIVILEIVYVLKNLYKFSFDEMEEVIEAIKNVRGITIIDKTDFEQAYDFFKKYKIKFTDCLIASQVKDDMTLVSYDEDFNKMKDLEVLRPISPLFSQISLE